MNTNSEQEKDETLGTSLGIIGAIAGLALALALGFYAGESSTQKESAKNGHGEYAVNPETGSVRFKWKQPATLTVTNEPTHTATALALKFAIANSENLSGLVKLNETMVQKIIDLSRRVTELEQKRFDQFLQPRHEFYGPIYTNHIPRYSTNGIEWLPSVTNVYLTNLYLGKGVTITNGMLYIQD